MNGSTDPKAIARQFNEHVNNQNIIGLAELMTENHRFVDRKGKMVEGKGNMTKCWVDFSAAFPEYKNTFTRMESRGNLVILFGYANWKRDGDPDYAIWTATIENNLVAEWRIYENTEANRKLFQCI